MCGRMVRRKFGSGFGRCWQELKKNSGRVNREERVADEAKTEAVSDEGRAGEVEVFNHIPARGRNC